MGRQVQFHALRDDVRLLLDFACGRDPVVVTLLDSDSPEIQPVADPASETRTMTLWNTTLVTPLVRKRVVRSEGGDYYRVDYSLPTLEFSPSRRCEWNGQQALLQGRIYGFALEGESDIYQEWYDSIARWIRKHFDKNPIDIFGGYIGTSAFKWFLDGGVLLPSFPPPVDEHWLSVVARQHKQIAK